MSEKTSLSYDDENHSIIIRNYKKRGLLEYSETEVQINSESYDTFHKIVEAVQGVFDGE